MAQELSQTIVCLLSALGYLAYAPGAEDEAVLVGYISPALLKVLAASQGSKVSTSAFSLISGAHLQVPSGIMVPTLGIDTESFLASSELPASYFPFLI